jgi:aldehyde dehydrogenase (NAD(P)+)
MTNDRQTSLSVEDAVPLEAVLRRVHAQRETWALTPVERRRTYLERVIRDTMNVAPLWNVAACRAKGIDRTGPGAAEELLAGIAAFVRMATTLEQSLRDIAAQGRPRYPGPVRQVGDDQIAIGVLPATVLDKVLYTGLTGEVWFRPGIDEATVQARQAAAYADPEGHAGLSLILGAGNVASLVPRDILTKLFVEGKVVIVKANPVNDYLIVCFCVAAYFVIEPLFKRVFDEDAARIGQSGARFWLRALGYAAALSSDIRVNWGVVSSPAAVPSSA